MPYFSQYYVLTVAADLQGTDQEDSNESYLAIEVHLQLSNCNGRDDQKCEISQRVEGTERLFWDVDGKSASALDKTLDASW